MNSAFCYDLNLGVPTTLCHIYEYLNFVFLMSHSYNNKDSLRTLFNIKMGDSFVGTVGYIGHSDLVSPVSVTQE